MQFVSGPGIPAGGKNEKVKMGSETAIRLAASVLVMFHVKHYLARRGRRCIFLLEIK
jgi:hypothetical protein